MKYITRILALLGIGVVCTACYGSPHEPYRKIELEGKITDTNGTPIANIRVSTPNDEYGYPVETSEDGWYSLDVLYRDAGIQLEFDDVDGEENGGDFASKSIVVSANERVAPTVVMQLKSNE